MSDLPPLLESNLRALARTQRDLTRRILWPCEDAHLVELLGRPALNKHGSELIELAVRDADLAGSVADLPDAAELFVFGIGLGEQVAHLLATRPGARLVVWDRDPWLLRATLARHAWAAEIERGRLVLALGVDLLAHLADGRPRLLHPLLARVYAHELRLLLEPPSEPRWAALGVGELFVADLSRALEAEGFRVFPLELARWSREEIEHALATLAPELVVSVNYPGGLAEVCREHGRKLIVWEIDPNTDRVPRCDGDAGDAHVFTWRAANVAAFGAAGFPRVEHLPLAADVDERRPLALGSEERARYAAPVAFVGASMVAQATVYRRRFVQLYCDWHPDGVGAAQHGNDLVQGVLDAQRQDYATYRIPELADEPFGAFLAAARRSRTQEDPLAWLAEVAAAEKRLSWVAGLGAEGVHVWGDKHWGVVEQHGARYRGPAGHARELTCIYNAADIQVDIGRLYQQDIVTMRVFDVLACGGFLLAEESDALARLFTSGVELVTYRGDAELRALVKHYGARPDERRAIAARGRAAVLERHTVAQRVRHMLERSA
jgi:hypothetical protein